MDFFRLISLNLKIKLTLLSTEILLNAGISKKITGGACNPSEAGEICKLLYFIIDQLVGVEGSLDKLLFNARESETRN